MDHETAVRLHATERYLLRQMPDDEQDAFEEHYFLCAVCAEDVRAGQEFIRQARAYWRAENRPVKQTTPVEKPSFWERWLSRPAIPFSFAANAALGIAVLYLGVVELPRARQAAIPEAHYLEEISVMKPSRGAPLVREIQAPRVVILGYDGADASALTYQFLDPATGAVKMSGETGKPVVDATGAFHLAVPMTGLPAGEYDVVVLARKSGGDLRLGPTRIKVAR